MLKSIFDKTDFLFANNAAFIEDLYRLYLEDPSKVDVSWRELFAQDELEPRFKKFIGSSEFVINSTPSDNAVKTVKNPEEGVVGKLNIAMRLLNAYRERGHYLATLDPLGLEKNPTKNDVALSIEYFGLSNSDLNITVDCNGRKSSISELVKHLDSSYASSIGVECIHVWDPEEKDWLFSQVEDRKSLNPDEAKKTLQDLVEVEGFEQYLHTKFPGAKRFSIEGGDAFIVAIARVIQFSADNDAKNVVIGMAHRGRLSTLTKVLHKPYHAVLAEFITGKIFPEDLGVSGDVKYHMGYSSDIESTNGNKIHLSMLPNPSHLEAINPVLAGKVRAQQDLIKDTERKLVVGILVHGDAAFCGQGVVAESLIMSSLKPYSVGGIIHFVINNQIGFTANPSDGRAGRYSTEFAKIIGAPVLHVNGDDIEAVLFVTKIAAEYRQKFGKDIVIDIVCYRKYGHNEGDEPMYTQSVMYNVIKNKPTPGALYAKSLEEKGVIDASYFTSLKDQFKKHLDAEYELAKSHQPKVQWLEGLWAGFERFTNKPVQTGVDINQLKKIGLKLCDIPKDFALNPKLQKLFQSRADDLQKEINIDWATAEQLAFGSLLVEGTPVRITGQDAGRGTFSHRHSVLHSQIDHSVLLPLNNIEEGQAKYEVADSNLSEYAVLGFEYGYSLVNPQHLVIWEAQFGDFANGAQIVFDQFISSSETKWLRMSGLVMLLPHGFEGQGPEHSSARLERFLTLAAENCIQVIYPTTPASIFHALRRQIHSSMRKPLIVMSPKSLLRHKLAVSPLKALDQGTSFSPVLDDLTVKNAKRVIFCAGKVYYDLLEKSLESKIEDVAIIRLEQLYPFPKEEIYDLLKKYLSAQEFLWVQEEPENMGAWRFVHRIFDSLFEKAGISCKIQYVGREESASPACGSLYEHNKQQGILVKEALKLV